MHGRGGGGRRGGKKLSDPLRVLDGEGGWGRLSHGAWLQLGCSWAAGRTGVVERGGGKEAGKVVRCGGERGGQGEIGIWGEIGARRGERNREKAICSSGDQSIGRFSPCFFVNSSAFFKNFLRSFEYSSARSALRGCSGWGSFTSAMRDWITARHTKPETSS